MNFLIKMMVCAAFLTLAQVGSAKDVGFEVQNQMDNWANMNFLCYDRSSRKDRKFLTGEVKNGQIKFVKFDGQTIEAELLNYKTTGTAGESFLRWGIELADGSHLVVKAKSGNIWGCSRDAYAKFHGLKLRCSVKRCVPDPGFGPGR